MGERERYGTVCKKKTFPARTTLAKKRFQGFSLPRAAVILPAGITEVGELCFSYASMSELLLPSSTISSVRSEAFSNVTAASVDLSEASTLEQLPNKCFFSAVLRQLSLPTSVRELGQYCFYGANISKLVFTAQQLDFVGMEAFSHLKTPVVDLSAASNLTALSDRCFERTVSNNSCFHQPSLELESRALCIQRSRNVSFPRSSCVN